MNERFEIYLSTSKIDVQDIRQAIELELQNLAGTVIEKVDSIEPKGLNAKEIGLSFLISVVAGLTTNAIQDIVEKGINSIGKQEQVVIKKIIVTPITEKSDNK